MSSTADYFTTAKWPSHFHPPVNELPFFNPYAAIEQTENRLPHWQQAGVVYFVTFRLADALPTPLLSEWRSSREVWLRMHPEPWTRSIEQEYHAHFSGKIEQWLDAGHGSCLLRQAACALMVNGTLHHFDGDRVKLISSVVMPNHVHALFVQHSEIPLQKILSNWKGFSARTINR